jgi:hypothetical protein
MSDNETLSILYNDLAHAKQAEARSTALRIAAEEKIVALVTGPDTGQRTITLTDGRKITVKRGLNYRVDVQSLVKTHRLLGIPCPAPVKQKTTYELDAKGYEYYRENYPQAFTAISEFVTVTPKKIAVTLKEAR